MAHVRKRLTRKDLRRPDQFVTLTGRALRLFEENRRLVLLALSIVVALALLAWAWQIYQGRQNRMAASEFNRALELYQAGKFTEALSGFDKVEEYRWTDYRTLAEFYKANALIALKDWEKARAAAGRFLDGADRDPLLRQMGLVTLGFAEEQNHQCETALEHYAAAEPIDGPYKEQALLGKARCSEKTGDLQAAEAAYREHRKLHPDSPHATAVLLRIQELEARSGRPPGEK